MARICCIAGLFLLLAMISVIAQGIQTGETGNRSQIDTWTLPASSITGETGENVSSLQVVQVTNHTGEQVLPRISGNWIIWTGFENERDEGGLYLYDIANRSERRILNRSLFLTMPEISGNWVGWVEYRNDSSGNYFPCVCAYNILNGTTTQVTQYPAMPMQTSGSRILKSDAVSTLDISGDRIVWHDKRSGNMDIVSFNLSSGEEDLLTTSTTDQTGPSISGDLVIWTEQYKMEGYNIILHNLTSGEQTPITDIAAMRRNQVISGDRVVWSQWRATDYDICCYNISSGNATWITDESAHQLWPRISGDVIVWSDDRGGHGGEIYAYDLSTQTETQVTNDYVDQVWADVDGNNIVWSDNRTGNSDIYLCSLENESETIPQNYTVQLSSIPRGADIYVNNESQGHTPATLSFDRPSSCHIKLVKKGFRPYMATLDISASMTYVVNLKREVPGLPAGPDTPLIDIIVDSVPRGANVSIGDAYYGTTLIEVADLPASDYPVEVTLEGYQPNSTTVKPSGLSNELNVTLIAETNGTDGD